MNILVRWKNDYNVDINGIDQQHKKLIDMINIIYDSIVRKEHDDVIQQVISDMRDYAFIHFKNEEEYFAKVGYKDALEHIEEHKYFIAKVEKFRKQYDSNDPKLASEILDFLRDWLVNHITVSDKKYKESFKEKGIK